VTADTGVRLDLKKLETPFGTLTVANTVSGFIAQVIQGIYSQVVESKRPRMTDGDSKYSNAFLKDIFVKKMEKEVTYMEFHSGFSSQKSQFNPSFKGSLEDYKFGFFYRNGVVWAYDVHDPQKKAVVGAYGARQLVEGAPRTEPGWWKRKYNYCKLWLLLNLQN
jgi:hypothetical protein